VYRSAVVAVLAFSGASPGAAQFVTSISATASTVRQEGFPTGEALAFAPRLDWRSPGATFAFAGAFAIHDIGGYSFRGGPRLYAVSERLAGPLRFGVDAGLDGTLRTGAPWTAAADFIAEGVLLSRQFGVSAGAGFATGGLEGQGPVGAGRARIRAWGSWDWLEALASVEPVMLPGAQFTELSLRGGVVLRQVEALGSVAYRVGAGQPSGAAVQTAFRWFVTPLSAIELGLGSYLADPIQGLPSSRYGTLGIRVFGREWRPSAVSPVGGRGVVAADRQGVVLEFELPAAETAEIAGDWNGWVPQPMERLGNGRWRAVVPLERGVYHFNVRLDTVRWVVPAGVTALDDGFGGKQGVLVVM
jgi:hypothetical protein